MSVLCSGNSFFSGEIKPMSYYHENNFLVFACVVWDPPPPKTLQVSIQSGPAPLYTFTVQLFTPHQGSFSGFFHEPKQTWAALTASASLKPRRNKSLCFVFCFFSKTLMLLTVPLNHRLKCLPSSHYLPLFFLCLLLSVTLLEPAAHRQHVFLSSAVFKKLISSVIVSQRSTWKWLAPSQALAHGNIRILKRTHARTERERRIHQKSATAAHLHHGFLNDSPSCVCVRARTHASLLDGESRSVEAERWWGSLCVGRRFTFSTVCFLAVAEAAACTSQSGGRDIMTTQLHTNSHSRLFVNTARRASAEGDFARGPLYVSLIFNGGN